MEPQRPRWRFRISTLMLLVVIVGLLFERWHREREFRRIEAMLQAERRRAVKEAEIASLTALEARALLDQVKNQAKGSTEGKADDK